MKNVCTSILSAADTASRTGQTVDSNQLVSASFHFLFGDASAAGTVKIQASNDPTPLQNGPVNWIDIPNASAVVVAGAPQLITIANMAYRWIRASFVETGAGSTTITCNMNALSV